MTIEKYNIRKLSNFDYCFFSKGIKGIIEKRVAFRPTDVPNYFRLSFGDYINTYIEEDIVTNNQDTDLVMGTVAWCVIDFTRSTNKSHVKFTGITKARTRLFSIWINSHLDELLEYFHVYSYNNNRCEKFRSCKRDDAFLFTAK